MIDFKVIIVGGGPAGAACAWRLKQSGTPVIVLDRCSFPRPKTCAGWITPGVLRDLRCRLDEYPHAVITFRRLNCYFFGYRIPVRTRQHSIRRLEFDSWLIKRSGAPVIEHNVKQIREAGGRYIIDDTYRCEYLVGAGGTDCCVYRTFFRPGDARKEADKIIALEEEFPYDYTDPECHLWFFDKKLPGYAWYVPKGNGYLNVGVGGKYRKLKQRGQNIFEHWERLTGKLASLGLVKDHRYKPRGWAYYLRAKRKTVQIGRAMLVGDAAGLATVDMGEGIGPAVKSGILAADAIAGEKPYSADIIGRYSARDILPPW